VYYDGCSLIAMNGKVLARCSFYAWILLLTLDSTIAMHGKVLARCSVSQRHFARNDAIRSHEGAIRSHATAIRSHASTIRSSNCWVYTYIRLTLVFKDGRHSCTIGGYETSEPIV
jgi:hypothetical protein